MTRPRLIVLALIVGLFVWFFADALFGGGMFVFRDAGHYYYPLFQFVADQWKAGRVPLWNPYENLGVPLAANATSSVFYPGTLVFLLPLDYAWAYKLYVMGHVLLAAGAAYWLARRWGASIEAAGLGAISYAFCGNVLFQYCNVVFLVGAAWLPLAVLAAGQMLGRGAGVGGRGSGVGGRGQLYWAVVFGVVLALMTLGGNAEMAYHAGLIAAICGLWLWRHDRASRPKEPSPDQQPGRPSLLGRLATCRLVLLALAASVGLVLSAIQVLPSFELSRLSGRAVTVAPRTVYELPGYLGQGRAAVEADGTGWADGLLCRRLEPGTHHQHVYHFSVGPWRLAEYLWPNFGGRQFPVHRRWLAAIPAEGRVWVPSLYMGLVPLVLALGAMRLRRGRPRQSWLSWVTLLSLVASFGAYGLGWVVEQFRVMAGADVSDPWLVGAPFGGLYWLMTVLLPGYVYFRYPAKLLVIAALGLSLLAARGWDQAFTEPPVRLKRGLLWLGGASLIGAILTLATRPFWGPWLSQVRPDVLFGPLDTTGAGTDLVAGFLQTALLSVVFWWLLRRASGGVWWPQTAALVLVAVDLAVANRWMVACAPAEEWQRPRKLAGVLEREESRRGDGQPYRVFRHPVWTPPAWTSSASHRRLADAMRWDRDTLWPKYNLRAGISVAEVVGTMRPRDYEVFLWVAKSRAERENSAAPFLSGSSAVGAKYLIVRGGDRPPNLDPVDLGRSEARGLEDVSLWHNPGCLPRAWIVHQLDVLPPLRSNHAYDLWRRTEQVFSRDGRRRDLRASALVETDSRGAASEMTVGIGLCADPRVAWEAERHRGRSLQATTRQASLKPCTEDQTIDEALPAGPTPVGESCPVAHYDALSVQIEAELSEPGLVVLSDQFYPGWKLEVETADGPRREMSILRTNRVMRGAWLPAGRHRLIYRYRPGSFFWGAAISVVGWTALGALGIAAGIGRWKRRGSPSRSPG